jgi:anaerobic selenocysteine-containing dehydrogenase
MGFKAQLQHSSAEEIFDEFARTTAGRPNDQSALYYRMLRQSGPQQWPCPALGHVEPRRYTDGVFPTPSGRARFWARTPLPPEERPDAQFPFILTTGRTPNQWHTRTKSGTVTQLNQLDPGPYVQMHPADAKEQELEDGQRIEIFSRRGRARGIVKIDPAISRRLLFMPIHWNELWLHRASPNEATADETDAISKQPVLKYCAAAVRAVESPASPG